MHFLPVVSFHPKFQEFWDVCYQVLIPYQVLLFPGALYQVSAPPQDLNSAEGGMSQEEKRPREENESCEGGNRD